MKRKTKSITEKQAKKMYDTIVDNKFGKYQCYFFDKKTKSILQKQISLVMKMIIENKIMVNVDIQWYYDNVELYFTWG